MDSATERAELAFDVLRALREAQIRNPDLIENPHWVDLRLDAFERFGICFEAV